MPQTIDFYEENLDFTPIGAIITIPTTTTISDDWLLCNGSTFSAVTYPDLNTLLGTTTLPNMNGNFPRMTSTQGTIDGWTVHQWTTRQPRAGNFICASSGNHDHAYGWVRYQFNVGGGYRTVSHIKTTDNWTDYQGTHSHGNISGGDTETRPNNIYMAYHIKAK